jgi:hypothetical protein
MSGSRFILVALVALTLGACSGPERNPIPIDQISAATIPNLPDVRYWGDTPPENLDDMLVEIEAQRRVSGVGKEIVLLAISGGADNGAFGAGLMKAWSDLGTRPEFTVVTGVSTGALTAPFAFLGPDYDDQLAELYGGGHPPSAYFKKRSIFSIWPNASVADSAPLFELIKKYGTADMLAKIAREHKRGRRLLVQSANMDAQRAVIWDLGAIAASGAPNALDIFHKALLASASVPGVFPPVVFDVEVDGQQYQELHADGGVISQDTTLGDWQYNLRKSREERASSQRPSAIYLIRNGRVEPEPEITEFNILGLSGRAVSTLIKMQGIGDIVTAYGSAVISGADFRVTWIGRDFDAPYPGPFDPGFMKALYQYGYDLMIAGEAWENKPLMLMSDEERRRSPRLGARAPAS